jgi:magnesium/cobalt transport protein CorA
MNILSFSAGHAAQQVQQPVTGVEGVFHWLDIERSEADWYEQVRPWLDIRIDERHIKDSINATHPPFYDGTDEYDMLVVRAPAQESTTDTLATGSIALFITSGMIISIRPPGDPVFDRQQQRFLSGERKSPAGPAMLLYLLLDLVTEGLMQFRLHIGNRLSTWQDNLLDREETFRDWSDLVRLRSQLRQLELTVESQIDALEEWRDRTSLALEQSLQVRFRDLDEHHNRVLNTMVLAQHDIDAMLNIHYSAVTQNTNEILKFLAVISAVFLPLNLVAGFFGMNFRLLPWLDSSLAPWLTLAVMLAIVVCLLLVFRRRHWL